MDEIDRAQELSEQWVEGCIEAHKRRSKVSTTNHEPGTTNCCQDCDQPIPAARLAAQPNAVRCIDCQNDFEIETRRRH